MDEQNIIDFEDRRQHRASASLTYEAVLSDDGSERTQRSSARSADIEDLYSADAAGTRLLARARQILHDGDQKIGQALVQLGAGDPIGADNEVNLFQAQLAELFLCRSVSEGLAAGTIAIFHALRNRGGSLLDADQLWALKQLITKLYQETFVKIEDIVDELAALVDAGLAVDPKEGEILEEIFAE
jgi:hypothetical protein